MALIDLHAHTYYSDGTEPPEAIPELAKKAGLELCAVTDHDCVDGCRAAIIRAGELGVNLLPGVELDVDFFGATTMHILLYGVNPDNEKLRAILSRQAARRAERNALLLDMLRHNGMPLTVERDPRGELFSRSHIAAAMVKAGYARNMRDAFERFLEKGGRYCVELERVTAEECFSLASEMGTPAVLAHPYKVRNVELEPFVRTLAGMGLWGLEVHYPSHSRENVRILQEIAQKYSLFATCGSDFHGRMRPDAKIGCVSRNGSVDPLVDRAFEYLCSLLPSVG